MLSEKFLVPIKNFQGHGDHLAYSMLVGRAVIVTENKKKGGENMEIRKRSWASSAQSTWRNYEFFLVVSKGESGGISFSSSEPPSIERGGFILKEVAHIYAPQNSFSEIPDLEDL